MKGTKYNTQVTMIISYCLSLYFLTLCFLTACFLLQTVMKTIMKSLFNINHDSLFQTHFQPAKFGF